MELYKIFGIISFLSIIIVLSRLYRFIKVVKKLDQNKTVEEVGLEKIWQKFRAKIKFWLLLGSIFYLFAVFLH
jgi:hypothetical protein